jgi:glycosyltransferase involved in cell wall biosynthesis
MAGIDHARGETIVIMDADLQNDPSDIPAMVEKLDEGFDIISGWRLNRKDKTFTRKIPSKAANFLIRLLSGVHVHDLGCSLKVYRADILKQIKLYGEMHRFIPIYAHMMGAKIGEVVVNHRKRNYGASKYGMERIIKVVLDIVFLKFFLGYISKPIHFFGRIGLYHLIISGLAFIGLLYHKFIIGTSFIRSPLLLLSAMFFILGEVIIFVGILAEILIRVFHEQRQYPGYIVDEVIDSNIKN